MSGIAETAYGAVRISRGNGNSATGNYGSLPLGFTFDASRSNSIYGTTTYVRPQSIGIIFFIKY